MLLRVLSLAVLCSSTPSVAPADSKGFTGNMILTNCDADQSSFAYGVCSGYILGAINGITIGSVAVVASLADENSNPPVAAEKIAQDSIGICHGIEGVSAQQYVDIVVLFIENNPKLRHYTGEILVMLALKEAFPC